MKKYHVKTGDGKAYYGVNYEAYRQAESILNISQEHDPQAYIVEEECHFTNAARIRAMTDEELAAWLARQQIGDVANACKELGVEYNETPDIHERATKEALQWLQQPTEER